MISSFLGCCYPNNKKSAVEVQDVRFQESSSSTNQLKLNKQKVEGENVIYNQAIHLQAEQLHTEDLVKSQSRLQSKLNNSEKKLNNSICMKKIEEELEIHNISRISSIHKAEHLNGDTNIKNDTCNKINLIKKNKFFLNDSVFMSENENKQSRAFSEQENEIYPNLQLELILGDCFYTQQLKINASGLVGSMRKANDGITFFGCKSIEQINQIIDYELNLHPGLNSSSNLPSIIFMIYFKRELKKYFIRAYKNSSDVDNELPGILVQIIQPLVSKAYANTFSY